MTAPTAKDEGWAWPGLARKAHYFRQGRSLCERWLYTGELVRNQAMTLSYEDCGKCWEKLVKEGVFP